MESESEATWRCLAGTADDSESSVSDPPSDKNMPECGSQSTSETDIEAQKHHDSRLEGSAVRKQLTLTFRNLTVRGTSSDVALGETLWSRIDPTQLVNLFRGRKNRGNKAWVPAYLGFEQR